MKEKFLKFKIDNHEAILLNGRVEVSAADEAAASKIIMKLSNAILDNKILSLRINLPNKIVFISAHDKDHVLIRAEAANNKNSMN